MTQLDEARGVARQLFRDLEAVDPDTALARRAQFEHMGIAWVTRRRDTSNRSGWLTVEQVAARAGVSVKAVSMWCARGVRRDGQDVKLMRYPEGIDEQEAMDYIRLVNEKPDHRRRSIRHSDQLH